MFQLYCWLFLQQYRFNKKDKLRELGFKILFSMFKSSGLTAVVGACTAGWYCPLRSHSSRQYICPVGRYCPARSSEPLLCPNATFSNRTQLSLASECSPCTAGEFCDTPGLSSTAGACQAGWYCPQGSFKAQQIICPIGAF